VEHIPLLWKTQGLYKIIVVVYITFLVRKMESKILCYVCWIHQFLFLPLLFGWINNCGSNYSFQICHVFCILASCSLCFFIEVIPWANVYYTRFFLQRVVQLLLWELKIWCHKMVKHALHHLRYLRINDTSN